MLNVLKVKVHTWQKKFSTTCGNRLTLCRESMVDSAAHDFAFCVTNYCLETTVILCAVAYRSVWNTGAMEKWGPPHWQIILKTTALALAEPRFVYSNAQMCSQLFNLLITTDTFFVHKLFAHRLALRKLGACATSMAFAAQALILIENAGGYWLKRRRLSAFTIGHTFACCYSQLVNSVQPTAEGRTLYHVCGLYC